MKIKIIIVMLFVILFTVFVSQNTEVISIIIFLWKVQIPTIVLISITLLFGIILGFFVEAIFDLKKNRENKSPRINKEN